ncbi:MAG: hypothetical protein QME66_06515 [Candidatus Eisenbacteria bacterium]|nr:hypothetical protein [Candidatus Eisenbacteria bacterium]
MKNDSRITLPDALCTNAGPSRREVLVVALFVGVYVIVSLVLATRWCIPWVDEVMYTDPAANLALGRGFHSTAWFTQARTEIWASNTPLHEFLLAGWFRLFGFGLLSARVFYSLFQAAGALVLYLAAWRLRILHSGTGRVVLVALLLSGSGISDCLHNGRPEGVKYLLSALSLYAFSVRHARWRLGLLFSLGFLSSLAGIQLIAYAGLFCVALFFLVNREIRFSMIWLGVGMAVGLVALLGSYAVIGYGRRFLEATFLSGHMMTGRVAQTVVLHNNRFLEDLRTFVHSLSNLYTFDSSLLILMLLLAYLMARDVIAREFRFRSMAFFGLAIAIVLPVIMGFVGKYGAIYAWMGFAPIALCSAAGLELGRSGSSRWTKFPSVVLIGIAIAVGLPYRTVLVASQWKASDPAPVERFVANCIGQDEWVYTDYPAYYAVKRRAAETFSPTYAGGRGFREIPDYERERISAIIGRPSEAVKAVERLGGSWKEAGRLGDDSAVYQLVLLRRN